MGARRKTSAGSLAQTAFAGGEKGAGDCGVIAGALEQMPMQFSGGWFGNERTHRAVGSFIHRMSTGGGFRQHIPWLTDVV
jgi:hypothetical protein